MTSPNYISLAYNCCKATFLHRANISFPIFFFHSRTTAPDLYFNSTQLSQHSVGMFRTQVSLVYNCSRLTFHLHTTEAECNIPANFFLRRANSQIYNPLHSSVHRQVTQSFRIIYDVFSILTSTTKVLTKNICFHSSESSEYKFIFLPYFSIFHIQSNWC